MENAIKVYEYEGQEIEFDLTNNFLIVNATEMAKIFGKDVFQFTKSDHAKAFINSCLKPANASLLGVKQESDLIVSKQKTGTWMHRTLALKFAAWLDSDFEVWIYLIIDDILFGNYRRVEESLRISAERKNRIEALRQTLRDDEKYQELERLELEERQASYRRGKENKQQLNLFRTL